MRVKSDIDNGAVVLLAIGEILQIHLRPLLATLRSRRPRQTLVLEDVMTDAKEVAENEEVPLPARCDVLTTLQKLPAMCLTRSKTTRAVIAIRRGELGYYLVQAKLTPEEFNARHGISAEQVEAMENGSRLGWEVPGADPDILRSMRATAAQCHRRAATGAEELSVEVGGATRARE